jgi:arginine exporter protein ArgO
MKPKTAIRTSILMASLIVLLGGAGAYLSVRVDNNWPYIVVAVGTAAISFFGLLMLSQSNEKQWQVSEDSMRTAIAGTIVVVYLVLVGIVAFFIQGPEELPRITETMVTNFTTVVGIVIAFYFGVSAYVQVQRERNESRKARAEEQSQATSATPSEADKPWSA